MSSKVDHKTTHTAPEKKKTPKTEPAKTEPAKTEKKNDVKKPGEGDVKKPGEADKADISKDAQKPGEGKDGKKPGEGQDDKNGELDSMRKDIDDMKKLLDEMGKDEKEEKKPEDLGGCCGKSHGAQDKPKEGDINDTLLQDLMAVKAEKLGQTAGNLNQPQANQPGAKGQPKGQNGAAGKVPGLGGPNAQNPMAGGVPGGARAKLQQDYNQAKQTQAQIRPEVEQQVMQELGGAGPVAQQPGLPQAPGAAPQPLAQPKK